MSDRSPAKRYTDAVKSAHTRVYPMLAASDRLCFHFYMILMKHKVDQA